MESTAVRGIWTEKIRKGYLMEINTKTNKIKVYRNEKYLLTIDVGHEIYPEDVENAREKINTEFITQTKEL